jgi:hypothetical protein
VGVWFRQTFKGSCREDFADSDILIVVEPSVGVCPEDEQISTTTKQASVCKQETAGKRRVAGPVPSTLPTDMKHSPNRLPVFIANIINTKTKIL